MFIGNRKISLETAETVCESDNSECDSLIGSIISDFGGTLFTIELFDKLLNFGAQFYPHNRRYQSIIQFGKGLIPTAIICDKLYNSVSKYYNNKQQKYQDERCIIKMAKCINVNYKDIDYYDFTLGREVIEWMLLKPKTHEFKIINILNHNFESWVNNDASTKGKLYILVEYENNKYLIDVTLDIYNCKIHSISNSVVHTDLTYEQSFQLRSTILGEFIHTFETRKNVLEYTSTGLQTRPRGNFGYNIFQFPLKKFKREVLNVIQKNTKRAYAFIGPPGVGKSTILIKLEEEILDVPIIYISSTAINYREDVHAVFGFLRNIGPCIALFEDLDSYELENKQTRLFSEFLDQLDTLKHNEALVVIATMNEPANIHKSLLDRRGRIDKIYFVDIPKSKEEVINVFKIKYHIETGKELPKINPEFFEKVIEYKLNQSDICEIVNYLVINDINVNTDSLYDGLNELLNTKYALNVAEDREYENIVNDIVNRVTERLGKK